MIIGAEKLKARNFHTRIPQPTFFDERNFRRWDKFFWFVETSELQIMVTPDYYEMSHLCKSREGHLGSSFKDLQFWFNSEFDKEAFMAYIRGIT